MGNYETMKKLDQAIDYLESAINNLESIENTNRTLEVIADQMLVQLNALQNQQKIYKDAWENE